MNVLFGWFFLFVQNGDEKLKSMADAQIKIKQKHKIITEHVAVTHMCSITHSDIYIHTHGIGTHWGRTRISACCARFAHVRWSVPIGENPVNNERAEWDEICVLFFCFFFIVDSKNGFVFCCRSYGFTISHRLWIAVALLTNSYTPMQQPQCLPVLYANQNNGFILLMLTGKPASNALKWKIQIQIYLIYFRRWNDTENRLMSTSCSHIDIIFAHCSFHSLRHFPHSCDTESDKNEKKRKKTEEQTHVFCEFVHIPSCTEKNRMKV